MSDLHGAGLHLLARGRVALELAVVGARYLVGDADGLVVGDSVVDGHVGIHRPGA